MTEKHLFYRIRRGINLASSSFLFLWHHPIILSYLLISLGLNMLLGVHSGYDFVYSLIGRGIPSSFLPIISSFLKSIVSQLALACIAMHTLAITQNKNQSILNTIQQLFHRIIPLITWIAALELVTYASIGILNMLYAYTNTLYIADTIIAGISLVISTAVLILLFYMVPIIATEDEGSIMQALDISQALGRRTYLEIMGGSFWIALIYTLALTPFFIMFEKPMGYYLFETTIINDWSWTTTIVSILLGYILATVQTVFRTRLYYYSYLLPREQEAASFNFQRF